MRPLSELDAMFLHLEKTNTPMHVGCVAIFEESTSSGAMTYERFRSYMQQHLSVSPVFRQMIQEKPFGLGMPSWEIDENFDLDLHIAHVSLPDKSTLADLRRFCGKEFGRLLSRDKPLWEMTYVSNIKLDNKRRGFALVIKIHHAAADGVAFESILHHLFGEAKEANDTRSHETLGQVGSEGETHSYLHRALTAGGQLVTSSTNIARGLLSSDKKGEPDHSIYAAPKTIFDRPITARRVFDSVRFPMDKLKALADSHSRAKVNDVVLTISGTAIRRYMAHKGALPEKSLTAMVPVSTRTVGAKGVRSGNNVSAMLVSLITDEPSILARLNRICDQTKRGKKRKGGLSLRHMIDIVPSYFLAKAMELYAAFESLRLTAPPFNLVITNIPGPKNKLYLDGAPIINVEGHAPIFDGVGMIMVVSSYLDMLNISVTSCPSVLEEPSLLMRYLQEAFDELSEELQKGEH